MRRASLAKPSTYIPSSIAVANGGHYGVLSGALQQQHPNTVVLQCVDGLESLPLQVTQAPRCFRNGRYYHPVTIRHFSGQRIERVCKHCCFCRHTIHLILTDQQASQPDPHPAGRLQRC